MWAEKGNVSRKRRRRVQKRTLPARDLWDPSKNDISHHSVRRMRRYRMRRFIWFVQVAFFLSLGLAIPYVAKWGYEKLIYQSQHFQLANFEIETSGSLSEEVISGACGTRPGANLMDIDLEEVTRRLQSLPEIASVEVERNLPDQLSVKVRERTPVAWFSGSDQSTRPLREGGILLDDEGYHFPCREVIEEIAHLPTIQVDGLGALKSGQPIDSFQVRAALDLIESSRLEFGAEEMKITDIRALGTWGLLCRYPGDLLVTFDLNRIEGGLRDLAVIVKKSRSAKLSLKTVNLVTVKNIPVTFHSAQSPDGW